MLHPDGRVGVTEEELEEIVQAVQEDADIATNAETAAQAVGALTTEARVPCSEAAGQALLCQHTIVPCALQKTIGDRQSWIDWSCEQYCTHKS